MAVLLQGGYSRHRSALYPVPSVLVFFYGHVGDPVIPAIAGGAYGAVPARRDGGPYLKLAHLPMPVVIRSIVRSVDHRRRNQQERHHHSNQQYAFHTPPLSEPLFLRTRAQINFLEKEYYAADVLLKFCISLCLAPWLSLYCTCNAVGVILSRFCTPRIDRALWPCRSGLTGG